MSDQNQGPGWWKASDGKWYPPQGPPPPPVRQRQAVTIPVRERIEWVALVGCVALVLGSFMSWASAGPFKVAGTDGDGWLTVVFGVFAAWLVWRRSRLWAAVIAGLGLALVVWKFADIAGAYDEDALLNVTPGVGLYVCGIGATVALVASFKSWRSSR